MFSDSYCLRFALGSLHEITLSECTIHTAVMGRSLHSRVAVYCIGRGRYGQRTLANPVGEAKFWVKSRFPRKVPALIGSLVFSVMQAVCTMHCIALHDVCA